MRETHQAEDNNLRSMTLMSLRGTKQSLHLALLNPGMNC